MPKQASALQKHFSRWLFSWIKSRKKKLYKTKDGAVKNRGKKARGSMWIILPKMLKWLLKEVIVNHFISSKKSQLASLHYLEKLSRINRKNFNREKNKKWHFSRTKSASTTRHFNKEMTFPELNTKHVTSQSEDWKAYRKLKFVKVSAVGEWYGTKKKL